MCSDSQRILKALENELYFLNNGGYRDADRWREQLIFLDSPICVNPGATGRPEACTDCPLLGFVPKARRTALVPCHHIPLTNEGFTVDSLSTWGTHEELESALRSWLTEKIEALSGNDECSPRIPEEIEGFCTRMAG
jgi:hypothetical protein